MKLIVLSYVLSTHWIHRRVTYGTADLATTGAELTERAECVSAQDIIKHISSAGER